MERRAKCLAYFESDYDTDFNLNSFYFFASDGQKRFRCNLPCEVFADYLRLPGGADVERHFNLSQAIQWAQASYDAHGLEQDGTLSVKPK